MARWLFVTNHTLVLYQTALRPRITAKEAAEAIGITERAVRKIITDLHAGGYIRKLREGRRVRYSLNPALHLRHANHAEVPILEFLRTLGLKRNNQAPARTGTGKGEAAEYRRAEKALGPGPELAVHRRRADHRKLGPL